MTGNESGSMISASLYFNAAMFQLKMALNKINLAEKHSDDDKRRKYWKLFGDQVEYHQIGANELLHDLHKVLVALGFPDPNPIIPSEKKS